jgi:hypothetical protein
MGAAGKARTQHDHAYNQNDAPSHAATLTQKWDKREGCLARCDVNDAACMSALRYFIFYEQFLQPADVLVSRDITLRDATQSPLERVSVMTIW